ncbi:MAG: membrane protein [Acidimicrobiales bacterium]|nr:MAG: membrane protein [Acidimicrobiales bacterium]
MVAVVTLIVANAVFVAAEFSLVACDRARMESLAERGSRAAMSVRRLTSDLSYHLSGAQLGITATSLLLGFIARPTVSRVLEHVAEMVLPSEASTPRAGLSLGVAFVIVTIVQTVFGELTPKNVAIARPERTALAVAGVMEVYGALARPVVALFDGAADRVVRAFGLKPARELSPVRGLPEILLMFDVSTRSGVLGRIGALARRAATFGEKTAADALVPRVDVVSVSADASAEELVELSRRTGRSRFPVEGADVDDIVGVVHVKSVLAVPRDSRREVRVRELMAEATIVPESMPLSELLWKMQTAGGQLAVVVDEFGGTAGIVTLEDVIEEIVGEIGDEYDMDFSLAGGSSAGEDVWYVPGSLRREELAEVCGLRLPEGDYDTLAGFVLWRLGKIPEVGESVVEGDWVITVLEMERRRIAAVRIERLRR